MRLRSRFRPRGAMVALMLAAVMIASMAPVGAADEAERATGTLYVKVYSDAARTKPVEGVEVFVGGAGAPLYDCTNPGGVAIFPNVPANVDLVSATGPAVALSCSNPDFLTKASNGQKMYWMAYQQSNLGTSGWTKFQVPAGRRKIIVIIPRIPNQNRVCGGKPVTHKGTLRDDLIIGTPGDDVIIGFRGNDVIWGGDGNDTICGETGKDILIGDNGDDWLIGGGQDDVLLGAAGHDRLVGNDGNDRMVGGSGNDWFWGLNGTADWAQRAPGNDTIHMPTTEIRTPMVFIPL